MSVDFYTLTIVFGGLDFLLSGMVLFYLLIFRRYKIPLILFLVSKLIFGIGFLFLGYYYLKGYDASIYYIDLIFLLGFLFLAFATICFDTRIYKRKLMMLLAVFVLYNTLDFLLIKEILIPGLSSTLLILFLFSISAHHLWKYKNGNRIPIVLFVLYIIVIVYYVYKIFLYSFGALDPNYLGCHFYNPKTFLISIVFEVVSSLSVLLMYGEFDRNELLRQTMINQIVFEQSPLSFIITDAKGVITYVNPKFCAVTGYTCKEAIGNNPNILKTENTPSKVHQELWETLLKGRVWNGTFVNKKKNGEIYCEDAAIAPLINDRNEVFAYFAIKEDVTKRIKAEELISKQKSELEKLNESKVRFFSIIAHDLRGPIGNILSMLEIYEDMIKNEEFKDAEEALAITKDTAERSYELLSHLLAWGHSQMKTLKPKKDRFLLVSVVKEVVELNVVNSNSKNIKIIIFGDKDAFLDADLEMIRTVFRNIIGNAIKFSNNDSCIEIQICSTHKSVEISVLDFGVGIPEDKLNDFMNDHLIETTFGTKGEKGTGFGLQLSKELVQANNGAFEVKSIVGKGTRVLMKFPNTL